MKWRTMLLEVGSIVWARCNVGHCTFGLAGAVTRVAIPSGTRVRFLNSTNKDLATLEYKEADDVWFFRFENEVAVMATSDERLEIVALPN